MPRPSSLFTILVFVFLQLFSHSSISQVIGPPSLTAGAGGVLLEQGALDTELIGAIIASKQDEIKKELAKRLILEKLEEGPYVSYQFAERMITLLFNEKEPKVIKKEILQYGAEYMIVLGILEFYAANHFNTTKRDSTTKFYVHEIARLLEEFDPAYNRHNQFFEKKKTSKNNPVGEYFENPGHLFNFQNYLLIGGGDTTQLSEVLVDMTFEICRNNKFLQLSGFFQKETNELSNHYFNKYSSTLRRLDSGGIKQLASFHQKDSLVVDSLRLKAGRPEFIKDSIRLFSQPKLVLAQHRRINSVLRFRLENLKNKIEEDINLIFNYSYLLSQLTEIDKSDPFVFLEELEFSAASKLGISNYQEFFGKDLSIGDKFLEKLKDEYAEKAKSKLELLFEDLRDSLRSVDVGNNSKLIEEHYKEMLLKLYPIASLNEEIGSSLDDKFYYSLKEELLPELVSANIITANAFEGILNSVDEISTVIRNRLQMDLYLKSSQTSILYDLPKIQATFIKLLNVINNLDKAESYDYIFKFLVDIGNLYDNKSAQKIFNSIANATDKYLVIDKEENKLDIDVESMLVHLFEEYGESSKSDFSMYFSVGYNYTQPLSAIEVGDTNSESGLTYVSEKIGLKYAIVNWAKKRSYLDFKGKLTNEKLRKASRKPIVTDWHAIAFASGLLYSIDALNSENGFNSPLVGFGTGFTFFNGLDLNFNYAIPTQGGGSIFNVSFDIKITEYLSELGKKKNAKQSAN